MDTIQITVEHDDDGAPYFPVYIGGVFVSAVPGRWVSRRSLDGALQLVAETVGIDVEDLDASPVIRYGDTEPMVYLIRADT